ncbi:MAG: hypothetical protein ACOYO1_04815 [Bacteroidales bacterium]
MKIFSFVFLCFFFSNFAFSQEDKADYNDDYWSFGTKDVADFYTSENQSETTEFKGHITIYPVEINIKGKGNFINGKKDSIWTGFYNNNKPYFTEWYNKGKLKKGISYDISGKQFTYKKEMQSAKPLYGWDDFINYAQNYWNRVSVYIEEKYPENFKLLKNREIEVSFFILINEKGIVDIGDISNGASYGFNKTAAGKMLSNYKKKWLPALFKGQANSSKVKYTVYLKF